MKTTKLSVRTKAKPNLLNLRSDCIGGCGTKTVEGKRCRKCVRKVALAAKRTEYKINRKGK